MLVRFSVTEISSAHYIFLTSVSIVGLTDYESLTLNTEKCLLSILTSVCIKQVYFREHIIMSFLSR